MKLLRKRIVAGLLAITMIVSSLQFSAYDVYAQEAGKESTYVAAETDAGEVSSSLESDEDGSASGNAEDDKESVSENIEDANDEIAFEVVRDEGEELKAEDEELDVEEEPEADSEITIVETEIEGAYQFGDAPSGKASESVDPSFSVESDSPLEEVNGMSVVDYIYQEALKRNTEMIDISAYGISADSAVNIISGLLNEHPDLYYVNKKLRYLPSNSIVKGVWLTYIEDLDDDAFKTETRAALSRVKSGMGDLQKAIVLHDYLAANCEYDYENYLAKDIPPMSYTAYGAFVNRAAVCQGYALAYKYLLNQVGIECYMVDSAVMNHAWNLVKIDGEFYQVDVTWDDPTWDRIGRVRHQYMFLSDESFEKAGSGHNNWQVTKGVEVVNYTADDTTYDSVFWSDVNSPMILAGEGWNDCYYIYYDSGSTSKTGKIGKRVLSDLSADVTGVYNIGTWPVWGGGGNWLGAYSGLFQYNDRLYFNDKTSICSIDFDGTNKNTEFTIDSEIAGGYIYGSALCQGKVLYTLLQDPSYNVKTTVLEADIAIQEEPTVIPVESIVLSHTALTLTEGATADLVATVTPSYATDSAITWESSDASIASVANGKVTAVSVGNCTITATAGGKTAVCNVTVEENVGGPTIIPVTAIELSPATLALKVGESAELNATVIPSDATNATVTWESSNVSIARVTDGKVTAVSEGSCVITAKAGDKDAACSVTVEKNVEEPPITTEPYITVTKIKTSYVCGDKLNIDDLIVTYYDSLGADSIVTDYTTNAAGIDMSTVGTKELIVTYAGLTASVNIHVTSANKEGIKIELKDLNKVYTYTGYAITPAIIVTNNGEPLTEGIDYTVKYSNNVKASESAKITVTGKGNLSKSYTKLFTIEKKQLDRVEGDYVTVVEGSKISPVLTYNGIKLTSKDFKVPDEYKSYKWKLEDKDDNSKKTITVTGQGNFQGSRILDVIIISKAEQKNVKLIVSVGKDAKKITYDGQPKDIAAMGLLTISTKNTPASELKEAKNGHDGDYVISYPDDITSAGTKKFTVTGISDKCIGTVTKSFAIKPKKTELTVEYDKNNRGYTFVSTGTKVDDLVVKDGSITLEEGKDYKVSYSGNKKVGADAKFTVTGLGSYKGSKCSKTFTINTAALNNNPSSTAGKTEGLEVAIADKVFKKAGVYKSSPYVSIKGVLIKASNYTVTYYLDNPLTNSNPRVMDSKNKLSNGDTTVWVKIVGKGNYAAADDTCYVTASYRVRSLASSESYDLSKAKISFQDKEGKPIKKVEYTGEPIIRDNIKVVVTYKIGKQTVTLNEGEDYTVTFVNNVNKGKATVVITGMPNQNKYIGSKTATFSIVANNLKKLIG
ncbi:MAG: Ig-like domain-containing protein [Lachnospiraceae bacterium]|nr:Ig-like domain-containing protein [Lachnospiraceae bacterium]